MRQGFYRWAMPLVMLGLLVTGAVQAQQSSEFGDYEIHYSAMPTGALNAQIAQEYGILRSRTRGMIMLTLLRDGQTESGRIDILARDIDDELTEIGAQRITNEGWVSYIGTFPVKAGEALTFEVTVYPHAGGGPLELAFRQTFYPSE